MVYNCPRCGYSTSLRQNFCKHIFRRKGICSSKIADVSLEEIKDQLQATVEKAHKCRYHGCHKSFASYSGLRYHHNTHQRNHPTTSPAENTTNHSTDTSSDTSSDIQKLQQRIEKLQLQLEQMNKVETTVIIIKKLHS